MEFLNSIENNTLTYWLRESPSIFAYPTLIAFHTFAMAFLVGTSTGIALRMLGFASNLPFLSLRSFYPVIWVSAWVSIISGVLLAILDVRTLLVMPTFYIKMLAIVVAMLILRWLYANVFSNDALDETGPVPLKAKRLARAVLISWGIAIMAGRVTAYDPFIARQTAVAVFIVTVVLMSGGYFAVKFWNQRNQGSGPPQTRPNLSN